jgi:hypothetical protein
MSEPEAKKQKKEELEPYVPKNILLTGGAGEIVCHWTVYRSIGGWSRSVCFASQRPTDRFAVPRACPSHLINFLLILFC